MKGAQVLCLMFYYLIFSFIFILHCESYATKKAGTMGSLSFHAVFLLLMITKVMFKSCKYSVEG